MKEASEIKPKYALNAGREAARVDDDADLWRKRFVEIEDELTRVNAELAAYKSGNSTCPHCEASIVLPSASEVARLNDKIASLTAERNHHAEISDVRHDALMDTHRKMDALTAELAESNRALAGFASELGCTDLTPSGNVVSAMVALLSMKRELAASKAKIEQLRHLLQYEDVGGICAKLKADNERLTRERDEALTALRMMAVQDSQCRAVVEDVAKQGHFHDMGYCMTGLKDIINRAAEIAGGNHNLKSQPNKQTKGK